MLVRAQLPQDSWVTSYLFSFGTEVTVLEPVEMQQQLASYAEAIWRHHQNNIAQEK